MSSKALKVKHVKINGYPLLNIRLWCYSLALIHLVVTAVVGLSVDFTGDEDPMVRAYSRVRWKLLTTVFHITMLGYLPLCLYCDWCEKRADEPSYMEQLRILRDIIMTSIVMPITTFADVIFWILKTYPGIIAPPHVFEYVPYWAHHSIHTVSMFTVIMDLILTPRRRPDSMKPRLAVVMGFASGYSFMVYMNLLYGEAVYAFLSTASNTLLVAVYVAFIAALTIFYYAQWPLIGYVWEHTGIKLSKKSIKIK